MSDPIAMKIIQITPGSGGGFYCENCMRDEAAARALRAAGHDALMVPLYLPPTGMVPGERNVAPIFYGGINVYLQQKLRVFRRTPRWLDRIFDATGLLKLAGRFVGMTSPDVLGETTVSMLRGENGRQKKELDRLVAWLTENHRPDVVVISNVLLVGLARRIRRALGAPVVCLLQDEDEFLDVLPEPWRGQAWQIIAERAADVDRFIAVSEYFRGAMRGRLGEAGARIDVVHVGIVPQDYSPVDGPPKVPIVGFLSRACRAKGLDILVEALGKVRSDARLKSVRLRVAGGSAPEDSAYLRTVRRRMDKLGMAGDVEFMADLDAASRREFLRSLSVLSVPARRGEAAGTYVLEALATGIPVVVPDSGVFPELLAATGGGLLCKPEDPSSLAAHLSDLLLDPDRITTLGREGREKVVTHFSVHGMVEKMAKIYQEVANAARSESLC